MKQRLVSFQAEDMCLLTIVAVPETPRDKQWLFVLKRHQKSGNVLIREPVFRKQTLVQIITESFEKWLSLASGIADYSDVRKIDYAFQFQVWIPFLRAGEPCTL